MILQQLPRRLTMSLLGFTLAPAITDEPGGGVFDESNHGHNAGYTLLDRMFAMGQIQGVIATVDDELGIEYKQPGFYD